MRARRLEPAVKSALLPLVLLAGIASGQVTPEEHAKHHPEDAGAAPGTGAGAQDAGDAAGGGMMGGMGGMMDAMHSPPLKELYPSLMEIESLPLEERAAVQARAHQRMLDGAERLSRGLERLTAAAPGDDYAAMQGALAEMREGLAEFDSGLAAHRALAEGRSPKSVAMQWFKREMNLLDPAIAPVARGPFGLSWFHFFTMSVLSAFAVVMIAMYFLKMRRATELLREMVDAAPAAGPGAPDAAPADDADRQAEAATAAPSAPPPPAAAPVAAPAVRAAPDATPWAGSLRVASILTETRDIKTFRLMDPSGAPLPFRHVPGQFLTLACEPEGKLVKRSYTIASSPTTADYAEITVKREAEGLVSRFLHDRVTEGDLLQVKAPAGSFTFTGEESDGVVLIGGGVGITPLMSVIRYLTDRSWPGEITLLYCCRTSADFVFREELEARQRRHRTLNVVATMTREAGTVWMGPTGRLTRELILTTVPDIAARRVHVCGPPPMMDAMTGILRDLGTAETDIHTEAFGPAKKPAAAVPAADVAAAAAGSGPPVPAVTTATVTFATSGREAPLPPGMTILDVADQVGVEIDNSCRSGSCGSCRVKLLQGRVEMEVDDGLEPGEREAGYILACQATSDGDVSVDA